MTTLKTTTTKITPKAIPKRKAKPARTPPKLRLTPYAWGKLLRLRDLGPTEVGGFGISSAGDLLLVEDIQLIQQTCTAVTVELDDAAVADYFDQQVDAGRTPEQFGRIWVHTHPGDSADPSNTDEATFERCFGSADWAVMLILAKGGQSYARLRFSTGPGGEVRLPVEVDYSRPFAGSDFASWDAEYAALVHEIPWPVNPWLDRRGPLWVPSGDALDDFDPRVLERQEVSGPAHDDIELIDPFLEEFHDRLA